MKTTFTIEADTKAMIVELRIKQGGKVKYRRQFTTVTEAAAFMLDGIATVMERHTAPSIEQDLADQTAREVREES